MSIASWRQMDAVLKSFRHDGREARLWWRDDDAEVVTPELLRLAARAERHDIPLSLAVIPAGASKGLREILARGRGWTAMVHGFAHKSYAPAGEKKAEFGAHRPLARMGGELRMGLDRLCGVLPDHARSVFVPPWNRIAPDLVPELPALGFAALSTFGPRPERPALPMLNTHLDVMNWREKRFAGAQELLDKLSALLEFQRQADESAAEPIGILTHHRQHDAAAEAFLDKLASRLSSAGTVRWLGLDDALHGVTAGPEAEATDSIQSLRPAKATA